MALAATGSVASTVDLTQYETFHEAIKLVRGDTLPQLTMTLRDSNTAADGATLDKDDPDTWAPIDLTGAVIRMKLRAEGAATVKESIPMYVQGDPQNGVVFMGWTATALDTAGKFTGEIEITYGGSSIITVFKQLSFIVREDY